MTAGNFQKRTLSRRAFVAGLGEIISSLSDWRILRKQPAIPRSFGEKIMLAVTQVNDCRYCSYVHTRKALNAGVSEVEVRSLLDGVFEHSPSDQLIALAFAQHYAVSEGHPEAQALRELERTYGSESATVILAYIRIIFFANLAGNTLDKFLYHLGLMDRNKPSSIRGC
jgi:AhpD family alkylhydroperoxidase